jgi:uncharacterized repeat protein (TIGR01451 family)
MADVAVATFARYGEDIQAGDTIRFDVEVSNRGPAGAELVELRQAPRNLLVTSVSGGCYALPCRVGALAPGAKAVIHVSAQVAGQGGFADALQAVSRPLDPNPDNNAASVAGYASPVTATQTGGAPAPSSEPPAGHPPRPPRTPSPQPARAPPAPLPSQSSAPPSGLPPASPMPAPVTAPSPPAPPPPELALSTTLTPSAPYRSGQTVSLTIDVRNAGAAPAIQVALTHLPTRLKVLSVDGACEALPCGLTRLAGASDALVRITARIDARAGQAFEDRVTVTPAGGARLDAGASGEVSPSRPSPWLIGAAGLGGLALLAAVASAGRVARWRRLVNVETDLEDDGEVSSGLIAPAAPTLGVSAHLEPGEAEPEGPIPIRKEP